MRRSFGVWSEERRKGDSTERAEEMSKLVKDGFVDFLNFNPSVLICFLSKVVSILFKTSTSYVASTFYMYTVHHYYCCFIICYIYQILEYLVTRET